MLDGLSRWINKKIDRNETNLYSIFPDFPFDLAKLLTKIN